MTLGYRSCTSIDPNLRASTYSKMWACSMLMNMNTDELYREQWIIREIKYGLLLAEFLVLFFPRLVQEPSECCREKPQLLVIRLHL